ncbi:MAG TPA: dienelactone hydrolase family protein [Candidatus Limnocylindrales bacterium]|nr:dienelactone hydrolase family protein [Candidatus Limnocylindrales bacterium]
MCFDPDSRPPIEPIAGGASDGERVILQGADGASFAAFAARPAHPSGAGILILPDVRGLHPYYEELALRHAEHGIAALAIDYFGRTAGTEARPHDFDYQPHLAQISWPNVEGEIRAGVAYLRSGAVGAPSSIFSTGFCMGGRLASLAATLGLGLSGVIAWYGWPTGAHRTGSPAPADLADRIECPVLAIYGGADQNITAEVRDAYDAALSQAGVEHRTIVYEGAPHSFFDRTADQHAEASSKAWAEELSFIERHTRTATPA